MLRTMASPHALAIESSKRCFGGMVHAAVHASRATGTSMRLSVFVPPAAARGPVPVLYWLSGLTCTDDNFTTKAGAQRYAAEHGLVLVAPDTSPRGDDVPDDDAWDLGKGAGFYVDATEAPWRTHYRMYTYVTEELPALVAERFPVLPDRVGISGHSMGGHGALVCALRNPGKYRSVSAFSPIVSPSRVPWGHKAFAAYLGSDRERWKEWDATELVARTRVPMAILVDQGDADEFLEPQLRPELFAAACAKAGQPLRLRMQPGYDHSYFFVATFIGDHIEHHARALHAP
jgi:S-formylglutathione hydrolase